MVNRSSAAEPAEVAAALDNLRVAREWLGDALRALVAGIGEDDPATKDALLAHLDRLDAELMAATTQAPVAGATGVSAAVTETASPAAGRAADQPPSSPTASPALSSPASLAATPPADARNAVE